MSEVEKRYVVAAGFRAEASGNDFRPVLRGHPIVFNIKSADLGGFVEIIRPEAIERTLREDIDLRALVDHDTARIIGRKSAGTLRVKVDSRGLGVEIDPPNTTAGRDIVESVRRGDVTGGSFAFRVITDEWHAEDGMPVREVLDMRVSEVSLVTFPAYPDTDAAVAKRSLTAFMERRQRASVTALRAEHEARLARWK